MRATLYQALGIPSDASHDEVRAALRGQIRKYYAKTRDGQGNVEEALRFINHASRILSDPELRAQYDADLAAADSTVDERIAHVVSTAVAAGSARIAPAPPTAAGSGRSGSAPAPGGRLHHPGLTERVVSVRHATAITVSLCALFGVFIAVAVAVATPADALQAGKQVLIWATASMLALAAVYGIVHGIAWTQRRTHAPVPVLVPPGELAILNWRRQKSVFLGTSQPQEDAGWVFQLRMAELERAKLGRTSEPRPWSRLSARLFDYALWGLLLAVPLSELRRLGIVGTEAAHWLGHPALAPVLITATWIPVEAVLIAVVHTTPGKWLFGVYLQFSISDAYAVRDARTQFRRAFARAWRVWGQGVGGGFPLLAPFLIALAYEKLSEYQETAWDFAEDCLVTHGPVGTLNTVTGTFGLAAMLWLYGVAWHQPMGESLSWARTSIVAALPSPSALIDTDFWRRLHAPDAAAPRTAAAPRAPAGVAAAPAAATTAAPVAVAPVTSVANPDAPIDPEIAALFAARNKQIAALRTEGPRLLEARRYHRAAEVCRAWVDLELGNAAAWRCLGLALQAQGQHRDAVAAFRKAKQYDPADASIDALIERSQRGIIANFRSRGGR